MLLYNRVRRLLDLTPSSIGLLLSLPYGARAIALNCHAANPLSPDPVVSAIAIHNYEVRSMRVDSEPDGALWSAHDDPRVTRVRANYSQTPIDELPQFINIIRGE